MPKRSRHTASLIALSCAALALASAGPALALSAKDCSVKYQAAKQAGTLGDTKWNDFRKSQCSADASPAAAAPAAPAATKTAAPSPVSPPASTAATKPVPPPTAAAKPAPPVSGAASFPAAIDPKYASESAGKGRMHTCLDRYNANKAGTGNGGLKWIEKGGGYYSQCNTRLKG